MYRRGILHLIPGRPENDTKETINDRKVNSSLKPKRLAGAL